MIKYLLQIVRSPENEKTFRDRGSGLNEKNVVKEEQQLEVIMEKKLLILPFHFLLKL